MKKLTVVMLIVAGAIHLVPVLRAVSSAKLAALYGLSFDDPNLAILMRHRAVQLGLLGLFLLYAARRRELQPIALFAGMLSVSSFLWLAWSVGGYNARLDKVVMVDLVALGCLRGHHRPRNHTNSGRAREPDRRVARSSARLARTILWKNFSQRRALAGCFHSSGYRSTTATQKFVRAAASSARRASNRNSPKKERRLSTVAAGA